MAKAGSKFGRNKDKCKLYASRSLRQKHKETRIARDELRAKPLPCGHGSRYMHPDGQCRRCFAEHRKKSKRAMER